MRQEPISRKPFSIQSCTHDEIGYPAYSRWGHGLATRDGRMQEVAPRRGLAQVPRKCRVMDEDMMDMLSSLNMTSDLQPLCTSRYFLPSCSCSPQFGSIRGWRTPIVCSSRIMAYEILPPVLAATISSGPAQQQCASDDRGWARVTTASEALSGICCWLARCIACQPFVRRL